VRVWPRAAAAADGPGPACPDEATRGRAEGRPDEVVGLTFTEAVLARPEDEDDVGRVLLADAKDDVVGARTRAVLLAGTCCCSRDSRMAAGCRADDEPPLAVVMPVILAKTPERGLLLLLLASPPPPEVVVAIVLVEPTLPLLLPDVVAVCLSGNRLGEVDLSAVPVPALVLVPSVSFSGLALFTGFRSDRVRDKAALLPAPDDDIVTGLCVLSYLFVRHLPRYFVAEVFCHERAQSEMNPFPNSMPGMTGMRCVVDCGSPTGTCQSGLPS